LEKKINCDLLISQMLAHVSHVTFYERVLNFYFQFRTQFRVALLLSENEAIYSEPSVIIRTLEDGIPESEPKIIQASAVDQSRIMVQWRSGLRNNGPVLSYALCIEDLSIGLVAYKVQFQISFKTFCTSFEIINKMCENFLDILLLTLARMFVDLSIPSINVRVSS
jgi:hypothetical protein